MAEPIYNEDEIVEFIRQAEEAGLDQEAEIWQDKLADLNNEKWKSNVADSESKETFSDGAQGTREVKVNYPANSNKAKNNPTRERPGVARSVKKSDEAPADKKVERVVSSEVIQRKRGLGSKIRETFMGDSMQNVGQFIMSDIVVPAIKQLLVDALSQGGERMVFGSSSRDRGGNRGPRTNYNGISRNYSNPAGRAGESDGPRALSHKGRATHDFDEIVLKSRGEAEEVLDVLTEQISQFDVTTVADLYDAVGISPNFTDNKWGWTDLRSAQVRPVRGGYLLDLPRTQPID